MMNIPFKALEIIYWGEAIDSYGMPNFAFLFYFKNCSSKPHVSSAAWSLSNHYLSNPYHLVIIICFVNLPLDCSKVWSIAGPVRLVGVLPVFSCQSKWSSLACSNRHAGETGIIPQPLSKVQSTARSGKYKYKYKTLQIVLLVQQWNGELFVNNTKAIVF